jgi:predicted transcriptional regulator of viral defense system
MKWEELLKLIGNEAVFPSALLLAGEVSAAQVRLQLSRWVKAGRLIQLRRGLYTLARVWQKGEPPHPFLIANALQRGSYVSLQSALAFHGVIPEQVPVVTSVGPRRPETVRNKMGTFQFTHLAGGLLFGYKRLELAPRQFAFVAGPEKALLDLVHLTAGSAAPAFFKELRLQNPDAISAQVLLELAKRSRKPKLVRAARTVLRLQAEEEIEAL